MIDRSDKIMGMFLGIAIGDALGMPVETFTPDKIKEAYGSVTTYQKPDKHKWFDGHEAGTTTDDTQLTIAVAEALLADRCFNMDEQVKFHVKALEEDAGWGRGTRTAVEALRDGEHWQRTGQGEYAKDHGPGSGNGIAMKIAPMAALAALKCSNYDVQVEMLGSMTHRSGSALAIGHMQYTLLLSLIRKDVDNFMNVKRDLIECALTACPDELLERSLFAMAIGSMPGKSQQDIDYISEPDGGKRRFTSLISYPTALLGFFSNPNSIESMYYTISLGGDTDTNASMVGAMLGALHGPAIFPSHLVEGLKDKDKIIDLSNRFCEAFGETAARI